MKIFDDLYYFFKIVRAGSLRKAAISLELEQGSLSYALTRLEEKLNTKLIIRKKTGIVLTSDGTKLYNRIVDQYASLDQICNEYGAGDIKEQNELKIITTTGVISLLIIPAIKSFIDEFPHVRVIVDTVDGEITFNETDADVGILPTVVDENEVTKKYLGKLDTKLYCSKNYIEKYGKPSHLEELKDHRFIGYYNNKTGYKGDVDWHLKHAKNNDPVLKINSALGMLCAAKKGMGIISFPTSFPFLGDDMISLFEGQCNKQVEVYYIARRSTRNQTVDKFYPYVKNIIDKVGDLK